MKPVLKETDKAYFAGLFDGEGCVRIWKHTKDEKNVIYELRVTFTLTYASVLYEMKKIFGGSVSERDMDKFKICISSTERKNAGFLSPEKHKQVYGYSVVNKEACNFLKTIEQYCKEKSEQVHTAIEFYEGKTYRKSLDKYNAERCEYYYIKLQELKRNRDDLVGDFTDKQTKIDFFAEP